MRASSLPALVVLLAALALPAAARAADPVVAAAGDIACAPASPSFNGGDGDATHCRQRATSDLLAAGGFDAVLALGDVQYDNGELANFAGSYDPTWGRLRSITHPVIGNHEYFSGSPPGSGYFDYFDGAGNATGPAGDRDKGYYSFDVGSWHVVALNSVCSQVGGCDAGSPQERWLRTDLAAHPTACTLAFWHHPLFSSGGAGWSSMGAIWDALHDAGAEVVLNGHHHHYERFAPQSPAGEADPAFGIREFIVGTGGKSLAKPETPSPNSEVRASRGFGVLALTLHPDGYDWRFLPASGGPPTDAGSDHCHGAPPERPPTASTGPASAIDDGAARVNAAVDPHGQPTRYRFEYGPTAAYGASTAEATVEESDAGLRQVGAQLGALAPRTTYHARVVATNAAGTVTGEDRTFTTGSAGAYARALAATPGLLAHWRLADAGGAVAFDGQGANLGTYSGAYALGQRGALVGDPDAAATFDGVSGDFAARGPVVGATATLEGWFRWRSGSALMRDDSSTGGWILAYDRGGRLAYRVAGATHTTSRSTASVRDGQWHHLALTKDGGDVALYVDGRRVSARGGAPSTPAAMPWHVMRNGPHPDFAAGQADELAVYDRALPATTVRKHFDVGRADDHPPTTALVSPSGALGVNALRVSFSSNEPDATFTCRLDGPAGALGTPLPCGSPLALPPLADGAYRFTVFATDAAGNVDLTPVSGAWTIDTTVPKLRLTVARARLGTLLRRGLSFETTCSKRCRASAQLWLAGRAAKRLGLSRGQPVVVGGVARSLAVGRPRTLVVGLRRTARRRLATLRSVTLTLRVTATDRVGHRTLVSRRVALRR